MCMHTLKEINASVALKNLLRQLVSHGKQATTTDVRLLITTGGTQPETVLCCWNEREQELKGGGSAERLPFSSGIHSIFPFLHRLMEETGRERKRGECLGKRVMLSNTRSVEVLYVSFDNSSSFLKCIRQCLCGRHTVCS